jgi:hypothetical protein
MAVGGLALIASACGGAKPHAAQSPPTPLTSRYLCSRLTVDQLHAITGDAWHTVVAVKKPDIACDVTIGPTQPGEVHVMVTDGRRPGSPTSTAEILARMWYQHETSFPGFRQLPDGTSAFNAKDGALVVQDGLVVYSVQVISPRHPGRSSLPVARKILALVHA